MSRFNLRLKLPMWALLLLVYIQGSVSVGISNVETMKLAPQLVSLNSTVGDHWGEFRYNGVVNIGGGVEVDSYSSVLWGIPWGHSWENACSRKDVTLYGMYFSRPTHCVKTSVVPTVGFLLSAIAIGTTYVPQLAAISGALGPIVAVTNLVLGSTDVGALNIWGVFYIRRYSLFKPLRVTHSGQCLDVADASKGDKVAIVQWLCQNQPNQQFELRPLDGGYFAIVARHSSKCFDVRYESKNNGEIIQQYPCRLHQWNQHFKWDNGRLVNRHSQKCLDIHSGSRSGGAAVVQWDCHGGSNQRFSYGFTR